MNRIPNEYQWVWVSCFVDRPAAAAAGELLSALPLGENGAFLTREAINCDEKNTDWLTDTVAFQFRITDRPAIARGRIEKLLEEFAAKMPRQLLGVAAYELYVTGNPMGGTVSRSTPLLSRLKTTAGNLDLEMTLELTEPATSRRNPVELLSWGRATLHIPPGTPAGEEEALRQLAQAVFLQGVEGKLILPEILGHKVARLSQEALAPDTHGHVAKHRQTVLALMKEVADNFERPHSVTDKLSRIAKCLMALSEFETLLSSLLFELRIQASHFRFQAGRGDLVEILAGYASECNLEIENLERNIAELRGLRENLAQIQGLASVSVEENRERVIRHAERMLAAVGVSIAAVGVFNLDLLSAILKLDKAKQQDALTILALQTAIMVLLARLTWSLVKKLTASSPSRKS